MVRPSTATSRFLEVLPADNLTYIDGIRAEGGAIQVHAKRVFLLREMLGPVNDLIHVEKYPPATGTTGAVVSALFLPLTILMLEDDRKKTLLDFGCTTEVKVASEIVYEKARPTGRYFVGTQPAAVSFRGEGILPSRTVRTGETGLFSHALSHQAFADIQNPGSTPAIALCDSCNASGVFSGLAGDPALTRFSTTLNLAQHYQRLKSDRIASLFSPRLTDHGVAELASRGLSEVQQVRDALSRMRQSGYSSANTYDSLQMFLDDEAVGRRTNRSATSVRDDRRVARERQERQERELRARQFPHIARIYCRQGQNRVSTILCFQPTDTPVGGLIIFRSGNNEQTFEWMEILQGAIGIMRNDHLEVELPSVSAIVATGGGMPTVTLGIEIVDRQSGRVVGQREEPARTAVVGGRVQGGRIFMN